MTAASMPLCIETAASIHELRAERWNALAGAGDFYQSHEWLAAIESDRTARARYLVAWSGGRLLGALPLYRVEFEGSASYQPDRLRTMLRVDGRYLVAGARRCYRSGVMVAPGLPPAVQDQVAGALLRAALDCAVQDGLSGIGLFYLPTPALERVGRVLPVTAAFDSAETAMEPIGSGIDAFLSRLSSSRRGMVRREMRAFAATGWRTDVSRLADCLAEAASLVGQVERRHGLTTPDALLRRVFRWQVRAVDGRSAVLTCRDGSGAMVGCVVNYVWRDTLYSRAVGLDYDRIGRDSFAYFNLIFYEAIERAAGRGLERVHVGLATASKIERGAVARPLWTAVVHAADADRAPGIRMVDPGAMSRWREPYRRYASAFPTESWVLPRGG
ncbi:MAG TPA: GNAT family N-acetyltransferase [Candidatus Dormibacteraeota bacterium]|nr:GNAT family N-acetyltransferase [Candidatus Dormibacteraeota bacterium]